MEESKGRARAVAESVGMIGLIASLVFVGLEVRQNSAARPRGLRRLRRSVPAFGI